MALWMENSAKSVKRLSPILIGLGTGLSLCGEMTPNRYCLTIRLEGIIVKKGT